MNAAVAFGVAAGAVAAVDSLPYIRNVLAGRTQPHRGTWCIWTVLGLTALGAHAAAGGGWSLAMLVAEAIAVAVVFGLSLRNGVGGFGTADRVLLAVAGAGLVGWTVTDEPLVATVLVIVADLAGALMMVPKAWRRPDTETWQSFALAALAGTFGTLAAVAAAGGEVTLVLYPAYFALVNAGLATVILGRRRAMRPRQHRSVADVGSVAPFTPMELVGPAASRPATPDGQR